MPEPGAWARSSPSTSARWDCTPHWWASTPTTSPVRRQARRRPLGCSSSSFVWSRRGGRGPNRSPPRRWRSPSGRGRRPKPRPRCRSVSPRPRGAACRCRAVPRPPRPSSCRRRGTATRRADAATHSGLGTPAETPVYVRPDMPTPRQIGAARARQQMYAALRSYFGAEGFLEVDTPLMVPAPGMEPHINACEVPFIPETEVGTRRTLYLHTSPEYAMKRLLADGVGACFQICKVFRNGEISPTHNPEFTLLEFY